MKFGERWLREWVDLPLDSEGLQAQLSMLGLEVDYTEPAAPAFEGVVVGAVVKVEPHPNADKLRVCQVSDGEASYDVVCGAPNVTAGMRAPFARPGATLPGGIAIKRTRLRGVDSEGMLCSEKELGLSEHAAGIMELAADAPPGEALAGHLGLDDTIIDIDLTPNRGDCLSIRGVARDLAARNRTLVIARAIEPVPATCEDTFGVDLEQLDGCPRYLGRVIRGIDPAARSPRWLVEKLRRCGIRAISPTVDVTNFVMMELGQPMHAFDLAQLDGGIRVRSARSGERLVMLDGSELQLDEHTLVIADARGAVAMAGIMGGEHSGVGDDTRDIFLEAAFFAPRWIAGRPRRYNLFTDSGARFERGVDPYGQAEAMERATGLLLDICGGAPGPLVEAVSESHLPERPEVGLRATQIERLLGETLPGAEVEDILGRLGMQVSAPAHGEGDGQRWRVRPPSHRFDIAIEPDLIEELARIKGYDTIAEAVPAYAPVAGEVGEPGGSLEDLEAVLLARGYSEAVTYSFVDERDCLRFEPDLSPLPLSNPISSEMGVMRTSLWPGLVGSLRYNLNRQQSRVRLFEAGNVFITGADGLREEHRLGGVASGPALPAQWAVPDTAMDFFDLKGDLEAVLAAAGARAAYRAESHPALHPGHSARVLLAGQPVGWLGRVHPKLERELELVQPAWVFDLGLASLLVGRRISAREISRFPSIRRDISVVVARSVPAQALVEAARAAAPASLQDVIIFDTYVGEGVVSGRKSVSLGLILQDLSRTLNDREVDDAVERILAGLEQELGAKLRE